MVKYNLSFRNVYIQQVSILLFICILFIHSSTLYGQKSIKDRDKLIPNIDSVFKAKPRPIEIVLKKDLLYNQHTLEDNYKYGKKDREFQWEKIKKRLAFVDSMQQRKTKWGVVQNYKNAKGTSALTKDYKKDAYGQVSDTFGIERSQSTPLYLLTDTITPFRYQYDGSLVKILNDKDSLSSFMSVQTFNFDGKWNVPQKYVKLINDSVIFTKVVFVDVTNQNITTLEKVDKEWLIRSMNPATTGVHKPPHMKETPLGMYVIQEKKSKMFYLVDGTNEIAGFAPYANRFSGGGYIHGVPLVNPNTTLIEYSWSLGTIPRSHMCVRNATSHAKFIYDWAPTFGTIIFVIE